jgi:anti-sigma factor RsiW
MDTIVTLRRLDELLAAYGSNPMRWPEAERAAALALLDRSPALATRVKEARRLDAALDRLSDDVSAAVAAQVAARIARDVTVRRSTANGFSWGALFRSTTTENWPRAAMFAGVAMLGIVAGLSSDPSAVSNADGVFDAGSSEASVMGEFASWLE